MLNLLDLKSNIYIKVLHFKDYYSQMSRLFTKKLSRNIFKLHYISKKILTTHDSW